MCIGERIHTVRFGGKVFGQVQGDAAAVQDLSLTLLFSLLLTLLSVLSITFFFSPMLSHCRVVSFPRSFSRVPSYFSVSPSQGEACLPFSLSFSFCPFSPPLLPSGLLVSFRFSSLGISLRCARGDLGARPPTRELVNYFAQRDTSFLLSSVPYCHHLILSCSLSLSLSLLLSCSLAFGHRPRIFLGESPLKFHFIRPINGLLINALPQQSEIRTKLPACARELSI